MHTKSQQCVAGKFFCRSSFHPETEQRYLSAPDKSALTERGRREEIQKKRGERLGRTGTLVFDLKWHKGETRRRRGVFRGKKRTAAHFTSLCPLGSLSLLHPI